MSGPGKYTCGVNRMWADHFMTLTPGVPLLQNAIQKVQDRVFRNPQVGFPFGVVVVGMLPGEDPLALKG